MQEMQGTQIRSLGGKQPLETEMETHSSILPWEIHGQGSLAGYSPCGRKELDTTEHARTRTRTRTHISFPLQMPGDTGSPGGTA